MLPLVSSDRDPIAGSMSALPRLSIENVSFVNVSHPPVVSTHDTPPGTASKSSPWGTLVCSMSGPKRWRGTEPDHQY